MTICSFFLFLWCLFIRKSISGRVYEGVHRSGFFLFVVNFRMRISILTYKREWLVMITINISALEDYIFPLTCISVVAFSSLYFIFLSHIMKSFPFLYTPNFSCRWLNWIRFRHESRCGTLLNKADALRL